VLIDGTVNAVTDEDGAIAGFLAIQRDITARRQTEHALHESESLFRRIFDQLPVGAALVSTAGRFHRANPAFCGMLGWSEAELRELTWLDITFPEDRENSVSLVRELYSGTIEQFELEKRYLRKDGGSVWGAVSVRLITDASGQPLWSMPVVVDVTERRRLEDQLRQAQKMDAIGQLAGGIAHDFNNILTAIIGYSDLLADRVAADRTAASDLRQIHQAGLRAAALTRQLLAFSRKQVLQLTTADLNQVMAGFERFVRPIIGEDIDLRFDLSPDPVRLMADVAQLEQVAMNLIVNARDAMPAGGLIRVRTATVRIDVDRAHRHEAGMPPGDYVELVVEDTGVGMSEDTKRRLFEPFFTTKPAGKGTGLGLAVAYGIVRQMGGFIWVYSEEGRGSTFKVYFPRAEQAADTRAATPVATESPSGHERILLVEDDREVRAFAARVLRRAGYGVTEAGSGVAALEHSHGMSAPDLVIADVVMPGMSGPEFVRQLAERYPGVRVLFTSGYTDRRRSGLGEDVDLMEKPFTPAMLLRRVRASIDREAKT
jgi:PAS domain S-box-containing protein